ncbi:MAG: hypothetical protein ACIAS6_03385 [Phycisphaerales bacterium JB060]
MASLYPEGIPPILKRHGKWFLASVTVSILASFIGLVVSNRFGWPPATSTLGMIAMITVFTQRDIRRARQFRGQLCPHCMYDLTSSPAIGQCPECGAHYTKEDIVRQWRTADRSYQAKKLYTLNDADD